MSHVAAPLRLVQLAWLPLWLPVLVPLALGCLAAVLFLARNLPRLQALQGAARSASSRLGLSPVGLGVAAGLTLSLAGVGLAVAQAIIGKALVFSPGLRLFRVGSLDATLAVSADLPRGAAALVVLVVLLVRLRRDDSPGASPSTALAVAALASGALSSLLGDGLVLVALGIELLVVGVLLHGFESGAEDARPAILVLGAGQLAVAAFVVAFGWTAWGFGGTWLDGPGEAPGSAVYLPAQRARFAAVERGEKPRADADGKSTKGRRDAAARARELSKARAYLTMTTHPGARVFIGVAEQLQLRASQPVGVSPFVRLPVPAGVQTIAIVPDGAATVTGDGWEVAAVENVLLDAEEERTLVALGPSLSLLELEAQATVVGEDGGGVVLASVQNARPLGRLGASVAGLGMLSVLGWTSAVALAASPARRRAAGVRGSGLAVTGSLAAACLCLLLFPRLGFLWEGAGGGRVLALLAWAIALGGGALGVLSRGKEPQPQRGPEHPEEGERVADEAPPRAPEAAAPPAKRKSKKKARRGTRA